MGVVPCLPGFISAVNPSITVTDAAIELYYLNYLYGFAVSGGLYILLHWAFPDAKSSAFVAESPSAKELQELYGQRWDVTLAEVPSITDEVESHVRKQLETADEKV